MSLTLGIDTATPDTTVAVADPASGAAPLAERRIGPGADGRPRHGPELMRLVEEAVTDAGGWEGVERIAVGVGPGSFTGIRIGVATARALSQARRLPLVAVESTAALAAGIAASEGRRRIAVIDARRREVFAAALEPGAERASQPLLAAPAALAEALHPLAGSFAAGDGAVRFRGELESAGVEVPADTDPVHRLSARHVCTLGASVGAGPLEDVKPIYLRRPDAERWRERDSGD